MFEVISPSELRNWTERDAKRRDLQAVEGAQEIVELYQSERACHVYRRRPDGTWSFEAQGGPDAILRLPSVGLEIPLVGDLRLRRVAGAGAGRGERGGLIRSALPAGSATPRPGAQSAGSLPRPGKMSETTRVPYRGLITASAMLAMFMQTLDSTIANVALPYMQGSMSASYDEITWVLTSYVIAAAIMTAPVGWMAVRFGRKRLFIICIIGFTAASMLCGAAQSLEQLVGFRLLQGMFGAALAPLSQATMLDIYPFCAPRPGDGDLLHGRHHGADGRPDARRLPDRPLLLALGVLRQPAVRHPRPGRHHAVHARDAGAAATQVLLVRLRHAGAGRRVVPDDAGPRPGTRLVRLARDHRRGGDRGPRVLPVRRAHVHRREAVPAARPVQGPQLRLRHHHDLLRLVADAVDVGTARALSAEPGGLSGLYRRLGDGAARDRHHRLDVPRRAHGDAGGSAQDHGGRPAGPRLGALHHEQLDARRDREAR